MNKLLCLVGPTGTGKTAKAVAIAKLTPSLLISADSRQVYRGMDIVTGKDHPSDTKIYGIDIVDPGDSCSVAVWYDAVSPTIETAQKEGKQTIVVGGTGLYLRALTEGIPTMQVPINQPLRDTLAALSIAELQEKLWGLDPDKFVEFNHSDQDNPRRLIRAIEVAEYEQNKVSISTVHDHRAADLIGLRPPESGYEELILARVKARLTEGAIEETQKIVAEYGENLQSLSAIGYRSILRHLKQEISETDMIALWVHDELAYAKRQMTWFTKVKEIKWYDRSITGEELYASTKN